MLDRRTDCSKNKLRNNFFSKLTSTKSNRDTKIIARFIGKVKDAGEQVRSNKDAFCLKMVLKFCV